MNAHQIEPVLLLCPRLVELDFTVSESPEQALIPYVAHSIERKLCIAFLQQDRLYLDVVGFRGPSVVVDKSRCLEQIQSSKMAFLFRISN